MYLNFSFKHMDASDAVRNYAAEKTEKLQKYFNGNMSVTWNFSVEKQNHIAHCHVTGSHLDIFGEGLTNDLYASIDMAIDKAERQLRKHKEQVTEHKTA